MASVAIRTWLFVIHAGIPPLLLVYADEIRASGIMAHRLKIHL
jgi:hypothetical protein